MEREKMIGAGGGPENTTGQGGDTNSTEVHEPVKTRHAYSRPEDLKKIDEILTPSGQTPATAPSAVDAGVAEALNKVAEALTKVQNPVPISSEAEARRVEDARLEAETRRLEAESRRRAAEAEERARIAEAESRRRAAEIEERARIARAEADRIEAEARAARAGTTPTTPGKSERRGRDEEIAALDTEFKAEMWLEEELRKIERSSIEIRADVFNDLDKDIRNIHEPSNYHWVNPDTGVQEGLAGKLRHRLRGRVLYHNSSYYTNVNQDKFSGEFAQIRREEHMDVFATDGFKEAMNELLGWNRKGEKGEFFRLKKDDADKERVELRKKLKRNVMDVKKDQLIVDLKANSPELSVLEIEGRAEKILTEKAGLALELAEKTANVFMVSAYYDGIRIKDSSDPNGRFVEPTPVSNLDNIAGEKSDSRQEKVVGAFATWIEKNFDNIDFSASLSGQGCTMKNILYAPVRLQKKGKEEGNVEYLKRYCYLYVTDAVHSFAGASKRADGQAVKVPTINSLPDLIQAIQADEISLIELKGWAVNMGKAYENRKAFFDDGDESILNRPLVDPDKVELEGPEKGLGPALENFKKANKAFKHLSDGTAQIAMSRLLKGVLEYVNFPDNNEHPSNPKKEGYEWFYKWTNRTLLTALQMMAQSGRISPQQALDLEKSDGLHISREIAALQTFAPGLNKALWAGLSAFFKAATKH